MYITKDNKTVHRYLIYCNKYDLNKIIETRFFDNLFYIPKTAVASHLIRRTENEKSIIELIHEKFSKPTTYIDVGANIGYWTFARNFLLKENIKFYCFEPSSLNFLYLKKNLSKFKNIELFNCGLSDISEVKKLSFPSWQFEYYLSEGYSTEKAAEKAAQRIQNTGLLSFYGNTEINSEKAQLITLDAHFKNKKVSDSIFIKIDTEGYESKVLIGSENFLSNNLNITIQLEINFVIDNAVKKNNIQNSIIFLTNLGFKAYILKNFEIQLLSENELNNILKKKKGNLDIYFRNNEN